MSNPDLVGVQISHLQSEAICMEVAERLRAVLAASPAQLPTHLLKLTERLERVEGDDPALKNDAERGFR